MDLLPPVTRSLEDQVRALHDRAGAMWLQDRAVIAVRGHDRAAWLNGVLTQNTLRIPPGSGLYACAVGVKGRILSDLYVHARSDELLLVLPQDRVADVTAHLTRYIVMEDVTLEPLDARIVTVQGPDGCALARDDLGERFTADRLGRGGADIVCTPGDEQELLPHAAELVLEGALTMVGPEAWEVSRIEAGVPLYGRDFDATNFVQEAGITPRAVSFNKGCYLGQEVVCRLEMRGHVQKMLVSLVLDGDPPPVGEPVLAGGVPVGVVTSAVRSVTLPGRSVALAMVKYAVAEAGGAVTVRDVPATAGKRPVP